MYFSVSSLQDKLITLHLTPEYICCSLIEPYQEAKKFTQAPHFELKAYQRISLSSFQLHQSMLNNPTFLKHLLADFFKKNNLSCVFSAIALSGSGIQEQFIVQSKACPLPQEMLPQLQGMIDPWDYMYLYPCSADGFMFYRCSIAQEILMQYRLFALAQKLELLNVTTSQSALFNLYKYIHAGTFSSSRLAHDMGVYNNVVEKLFSPDSIKKLLLISPHLGLTIQDELPYVATALGLLISTNFYMRKEL
jgi:hypothetical protein